MEYSESEISFPSAGSGSRLLSESSLASRTGHGGDDLSLSELSIEDRALSLPSFHLLSEPNDPETPTRRPDTGADDEEHTTRAAGKSREDKLRTDLAVLRKINAAFASFSEALDATGATNEVSVNLSLVCFPRLTSLAGNSGTAWAD